MPSVCGLDVAFILDLVYTDTNTYVKDRENSSISFLSVTCDFLLKLFDYNFNENSLSYKRPDENILHIQFLIEVWKIKMQIFKHFFKLMVMSTSFVKEVWEASFYRPQTTNRSLCQGPRIRCVFYMILFMPL